MRLSHCDLTDLQRTILDLYTHRDLESFRRAVPNLFLNIIPAEYFGLLEIDVDFRKRTMKTSGLWESSPRMTPNDIGRMERRGVDHPFTEYTTKSGDPSALKLSDFYSIRQLRDTELYCEFYRHTAIVRLLATAAFGERGLTTLNVARGARDKDFTERDRFIMNLLRPHYDKAHRNAELASERLASHTRPLEAYGLTPREKEVAHWLSRGKTNPEIAAILGTRTRTVEKHVESILEKLAVENRTAAALIIGQVNGA